MNSETETALINGFRSRLAQLIGQQKPFEWAKATGIPSSTFDRVWKHNAIPRPEHLVKISQRCNVSIDWLLTGKGSLKENVNRSGTIWLPLLRCSEEGKIIIDEKTEFLQFSLTFLVGRVSLSYVENIGIFQVRDDLMEPTIHDGDFVIVDRGQRQISGSIMALVWGGEIHLRRIVSHPAGAVIIHENSRKCPNVNVDLDQRNQLNVIGKVVLVL
tara:strand:- start:5221 stop:5865 length:645 start_codon:yes stop_codon:yes gene_type:complete